MVDTFGVTAHGYKNLIGDRKLPSFIEPRQISYVPKKLKPEDRAHTFPKGLDIYNPVLDGYSYSSQHLHQQIKHKKFMKPFGPTNVYRVPVTSSMDIGWFLDDAALKGQDWMEVRGKHPWTWSEMTRYLEHVRKTDKFFIFL